MLVGLQMAALHAWRRLVRAQGSYQLQDLVDARWSPALAVAGVVLATVETSRTVSHWLDVPWEFEPLVGFHRVADVAVDPVGGDRFVGDGGRVRIARRAVWVAGASWMAVVVVKLFLVDLSSLTALGRVVSFIVVGVLLLIVGYLAPVPPAAPAEPEEPGEPKKSEELKETGEPEETGE